MITSASRDRGTGPRLIHLVVSSHNHRLDEFSQLEKARGEVNVNRGWRCSHRWTDGALWVLTLSPATGGSRRLRRPSTGRPGHQPQRLRVVIRRSVAAVGDDGTSGAVALNRVPLVEAVNRRLAVRHEAVQDSYRRMSVGCASPYAANEAITTRLSSWSRVTGDRGPEQVTRARIGTLDGA